MKYAVGAGGIADPAGDAFLIVDLYGIIAVGVEMVRLADGVLGAVVDAQPALLAPLPIDFDLHSVPSDP
jgi:hypothetical protein